MTVDLPTMPSPRLDGRRALVTGAGRGFGLACAAALAQAGAHFACDGEADAAVGAGHEDALSLEREQVRSQAAATHG